MRFRLARGLLAIACAAGCTAKPVEPLAACQKTLWNVTLLPTSYNGSATVYPEGLALDAPQATPQADSSTGIVTVPLLSVQQDGLEGDFTLTVDFDSFAVGDDNGTFNVELAEGTGDLFVQTSATTLVAAYVPPAGDAGTQTADVTATAGTVQIVRQGESATATLTAGGKSVSMTAPVGAGELALHLDAFAPQSGGDLTVFVKSVSVTGSTGPFQADAFACDSVQQ